MSWEDNKRLLWFMLAIAVAIGAGFASVGAWLIFPFAGLEIALLSIAMYYVSWKLNFRQQLVIDDDTVELQKGVYFPKYQWSWRRSDIALVQTPCRHPLGVPTLEIWQRGRSVEVGEFLNNDEKKELLALLQQTGLQPVAKPHSVKRVF